MNKTQSFNLVPMVFSLSNMAAAGEKTLVRKLTFSSQWFSRDVSLFLQEISLSLEISVHNTGGPDVVCVTE